MLRSSIGFGVVAFGFAGVGSGIIHGTGLGLRIVFRDLRFAS